MNKESELPLLPDDAFQRSLNRITAGNLEELERIKKSYQIKDWQMDALKEAYEHQIQLALQ